MAKKKKSVLPVALRKTKPSPLVPLTQMYNINPYVIKLNTEFNNHIDEAQFQLRQMHKLHSVTGALKTRLASGIVGKDVAGQGVINQMVTATKLGADAMKALTAWTVDCAADKLNGQQALEETFSSTLNARRIDELYRDISMGIALLDKMHQEAVTKDIRDATRHDSTTEIMRQETRNNLVVMQNNVNRLQQICDARQRGDTVNFQRLTSTEAALADQRQMNSAWNRLRNPDIAKDNDTKIRRRTIELVALAKWCDQNHTFPPDSIPYQCLRSIENKAQPLIEQWRQQHANDTEGIDDAARHVRPELILSQPNWDKARQFTNLDAVYRAIGQYAQQMQQATNDLLESLQTKDNASAELHYAQWKTIANELSTCYAARDHLQYGKKLVPTPDYETEPRRRSWDTSQQRDIQQNLANRPLSSSFSTPDLRERANSLRAVSQQRYNDLEFYNGQPSLRRSHSVDDIPRYSQSYDAGERYDDTFSVRSSGYGSATSSRSSSASSLMSDQELNRSTLMYDGNQGMQRTSHTVSTVQPPAKTTMNEQNVSSVSAGQGSRITPVDARITNALNAKFNSVSESNKGVSWQTKIRQQSESAAAERKASVKALRDKFELSAVHRQSSSLQPHANYSRSRYSGISST